MTMYLMTWCVDWACKLNMKSPRLNPKVVRIHLLVTNIVMHMRTEKKFK